MNKKHQLNIVLIKGDIALKDWMSSALGLHTWHFCRAFVFWWGGLCFPFPLRSPPEPPPPTLPGLRGHSDCQCSEAKSETFSKGSLK